MGIAEGDSVNQAIRLCLLIINGSIGLSQTEHSIARFVVELF